MNKRTKSTPANDDDADLVVVLRMLRILGEHTSELDRLKDTLWSTTISILKQWEALEEDLTQVGFEVGGRQSAVLKKFLSAVKSLDFAGQLRVLPAVNRRSKTESSNPTTSSSPARAKGRPSGPSAPAKAAAIGIARDRGLTYQQIAKVLAVAGYKDDELTHERIKAQLRALRRQGWTFPGDKRGLRGK